MLFYLRSRGLSRHTARALLIRAFASEVTSPMKLLALRARVEEQVAGLLSLGVGAGEAS